MQDINIRNSNLQNDPESANFEHWHSVADAPTLEHLLERIKMLRGQALNTLMLEHVKDNGVATWLTLWTHERGWMPGVEIKSMIAFEMARLYGKPPPACMANGFACMTAHYADK